MSANKLLTVYELDSIRCEIDELSNRADEPGLQNDEIDRIDFRIAYLEQMLQSSLKNILRSKLTLIVNNEPIPESSKGRILYFSVFK